MPKLVVLTVNGQQHTATTAREAWRLGHQDPRHRARLYMDLCGNCHSIRNSPILDRARDASRSGMVLVCNALDGPARWLEMTDAHFTVGHARGLTRRWS